MHLMSLVLEKFNVSTPTQFFIGNVTNGNILMFKNWQPFRRQFENPEHLGCVLMYLFIGHLCATESFFFLRFVTVRGIEFILYPLFRKMFFSAENQCRIFH